jgi:hypothetical protein
MFINFMKKCCLVSNSAKNGGNELILRKGGKTERRNEIKFKIYV